MKISIQSDYVVVETNEHNVSFDCTKTTADIKREIKRCVKDKYFDKYDGERVLKFVLQNKRAIDNGGYV